MGHPILVCFGPVFLQSHYNWQRVSHQEASVYFCKQNIHFKAQPNVLAIVY